MGIVAKLIMFVSAYKPNKPQRRVILHEESHQRTKDGKVNFFVSLVLSLSMF